MHRPAAIIAQELGHQSITKVVQLSFQVWMWVSVWSTRQDSTGEMRSEFLLCDPRFNYDDTAQSDQFLFLVFLSFSFNLEELASPYSGRDKKMYDVRSRQILFAQRSQPKNHKSFIWILIKIETGARAAGDQFIKWQLNLFVWFWEHRLTKHKPRSENCSFFVSQVNASLMKRNGSRRVKTNAQVRPHFWNMTSTSLTWLSGVNDSVALKLSFGLFPHHLQFGGAQEFDTETSWWWNWTETQQKARL